MPKVIKLKKIILWVILAVLLLNAKKVARLFYPVNYTDIIYEYSAEYNLDPYLIFGIIKAESNFDTYANSDKDARGLMQITIPTAKWIAQRLGDSSLAENLNVPEANIQMGCYYISYLLSLYDGNEKNALAAYNAGPGVVNRWLGDRGLSSDGVSLFKIPYRETELYVTKVTNNRRIYSILYNRE